LKYKEINIFLNIKIKNLYHRFSQNFLKYFEIKNRYARDYKFCINIDTLTQNLYNINIIYRYYIQIYIINL